MQVGMIWALGMQFGKWGARIAHGNVTRGDTVTGSND